MFGISESFCCLQKGSALCPGDQVNFPAHKISPIPFDHREPEKWKEPNGHDKTSDHDEALKGQLKCFAPGQGV